MIDLHCHILPGLDDGAQAESDLLDMAKAAMSDGITTIVATPHHKNGSYENTKHTILAAVESANQVLQTNALDLKILPGQECRVYGELIEDLENGKVLSMNDSKYLFVEFPSSEVPRFSKKLFYDIQMAGKIPVIVHPERNQVFMKKPEMLYEFVKNGALTQVTAASVAGKFGKKIASFSLELIEANLTHFIASDAHNVKSRAFHLTDAYNRVREEIGEDRVYFFQENAAYLIDGDHVMVEQPKHMKKKKVLGLF
ncbi:tyrosine protein phosphatase [Salipaludibacillus neizhouensis]|uniref:Tyrosine-protein phosphatase n=1 Tax=Salipaludibacillus neizhouensis TaxID=885475 RepID=A0A3A9K949_9BACI|nr:CpsB/CapC family capsule biosynthesis tyrosine phosphatase [Salipaludibacillus neizhouensis]RKL68048.1 tyrosine protein phosphatase [Salipaludibacillus neizhouensis]